MPTPRRTKKKVPAEDVKTCANCEFSHEPTVKVLSDRLCHRYPEVFIATEELVGFTYPPCSDKQPCGEWKRKCDA